MTETENLSPEKSKSGDNVYLVDCEVYGGKRHYAACLNVKALMDAGKSRPIDRDCCRAINGDECPAVKMRKQEIAAGTALFYERREVPLYIGTPYVAKSTHDGVWNRRGTAADEHQTIIRPKKAEPVATKTTVVAAPRRTGMSQSPSTGGGSIYADLINKMMTDQKTK